MRIKLSQLLKNDGDCVNINYELDFSGVEVWGEHPFIAPVKAVGSIKNRADMIQLSLSVTAQVDTFCARCLEPVKSVLNVNVDYDLVTELQNPDDEHLMLVEGDEFDVDETVRTAVLLNMPMRYLCREDCKGICPKCGANLNAGSCGCSTQETDPRLAILKTLL